MLADRCGIREGPAAAVLAVMLVGEGLADGEGGRDSACNSALLQFVGVDKLALDVRPRSVWSDYLNRAYASTDSLSRERC